MVPYSPPPLLVCYLALHFQHLDGTLFVDMVVVYMVVTIDSIVVVAKIVFVDRVVIFRKIVLVDKRCCIDFE